MCEVSGLDQGALATQYTTHTYMYPYLMNIFIFLYIISCNRLDATHEVSGLEQGTLAIVWGAAVGDC